MSFKYWQKLEEGGVYHLYNRAINKEVLFIDDKDYAFFLHKTQKYLLPYLDFYAYCLIPNHFHLLVEVKAFDQLVHANLLKENTRAAEKFTQKEISVNNFLEDQFRRFFSSYALYFNHRYQRKGGLFQKRFKRVLAINDFRKLQLTCYIHHNPIHHGITQNYQDWKYSSYRAYLSPKVSRINREKMFQWCGSGDSRVGKALFMKHHQSFKQPPVEDWMLDW